jgi:16S rRNA (guanine527-N7)-methyltransferase
MTLLSAPYDPQEIISVGSQQLEISLPHDAIARMLRHMQLVQTWNSRVNLTAVTDSRHMAVLHFLDSLTVLKVLPNLSYARVLDVGTGAGFPGVVLGSVCGELDLTLVDRNPAKIVFLKYVIKELGLSRVRFLNIAVGPLLREPATALSDVIVSRAFSSDAPLLDSLHVLLGPGGHLVRMTGPSCLEEHLVLEHFRILRIWEGTLPFGTSFRRVVLYSKSS